MPQSPNIFARFLLPFCVGIAVLHSYHSTKLNLLVIVSSIFMFILLLLINYLYISLKVYHHKPFIGILLHLLFFSMGGFYHIHHNELENSRHFSHFRARYLRIYVTTEPQRKGNMLRFTARVSHTIRGNFGQGVIGNLLVIVKADATDNFDPEYGEVYVIPASYTATPPPLNPAEFDSKNWLANQRIGHQISLLPGELVSVNGRKGSALIRFALSLRKSQVAIYRKLIKNDEAFAVAATLILGYRSDLDTDLLDTYSRTGTIHALSVSGMHVGIVYLVLEFLLKWMNRKRLLKWAKVVLILSLIWFYTLLTGCSASVLRSAIMLMLFISAKSFHKDPDSYLILFFSALCLLINDTFLLWDVGFQLSYLAVFGLIWLQPQIYHCVTFKMIWLQKLWNMITLSLAAQIVTYPLSVYYFHQFPVYFLLSNLFITFPVAVLMYGGLIILLLRLYWLAPAFEWVIILMNNGLEKIAHLPYSSLNQIWITKAELLLLVAFLCCLLNGLASKQKHHILLAMLLLILFQGMLVRDKLAALRQQKIILFSLNRHYAAAFIRADQAVIITDLPANEKPFRFHIQPALDQLKVRKISCIPWHRKMQTNKLLIAHKYLRLADHQLKFGNYHVLLLDTFFNNIRLKGRPAFDAIWIHGNPKVTPDTLLKDVKSNLIWVDGSNMPHVIRKYEQDTIKFRPAIIVLNKNKAYLVKLK